MHSSLRIAKCSPGSSRRRRRGSCRSTRPFPEHPGPDGIAALRRQIDELTAGTWRPLREDSFDIAASSWHAVIMDRFQAERGERRLDSHETVIVAAIEGRVMRLFHYLRDPACLNADSSF